MLKGHKELIEREALLDQRKGKESVTRALFRRRKRRGRKETGHRAVRL